MPSETSRPWAYIGLGAAALFAVGSVVALNIATEQRRAEAETAGSSTAQLEQRYAVAEGRAAALDTTGPDTARLDELDAAVAGFGPAVLQAADAVVNVNRLAATQEALAAAAEPLREQSAPLQTLDALDALSAHAAAATERQAAIDAEQAAPAPVEEEQEQRAPAPRPQRPAPPAQPAPTTEPTPSDPGVGDGGDAPVDPEVP